VAIAIAGGGNLCVEEKLMFDFDVVGLYPATRLRFFVLEVLADDQASSATGLGRDGVLRTWVFVVAASKGFDAAADDALVVATDAELLGCDDDSDTAAHGFGFGGSLPCCCCCCCCS